MNVDAISKALSKNRGLLVKNDFYQIHFLTQSVEIPRTSIFSMILRTLRLPCMMPPVCQPSIPQNISTHSKLWQTYHPLLLRRLHTTTQILHRCVSIFADTLMTHLSNSLARLFRPYKGQNFSGLSSFDPQRGRNFSSPIGNLKHFSSPKAPVSIMIASTVLLKVVLMSQIFV